MIPGVDVGSPQGVISPVAWKLIHGERPWSVHRCMQSVDQGDRTYGANLANARAAGQVVGAYFVLFPWVDPIAQARAWFAACGGLGSKGDGLAPSLDFELDHDGARAMTPVQVFAALIACVQEMTRLWGRAPTLYTYPFFWHAMLAGASSAELAIVASCALWFAAYKTAGPPTPPTPWAKVTFWQESGGDEYKTPAGAPCDADFFLGDVTELQALASFVATPSPVEDLLAGVPVPGLSIPGANA